MSHEHTHFSCYQEYIIPHTQIWNYVETASDGMSYLLQHVRIVSQLLLRMPYYILASQTISKTCLGRLKRSNAKIHVISKFFFGFFFWIIITTVFYSLADCIWSSNYVMYLKLQPRDNILRFKYFIDKKLKSLDHCYETLL